MNHNFISKRKKVYPVRNRLSATAVSSNGGFSTLELMIAMAILIMCLVAIISVSFGSQSMLVDSQRDNEALNMAQKLLESAQADARKDFNLANSIDEGTDAEGYQKKVDVELWKDPITNLPDFFTKKVTATVSWTGEHNRNLNVQLSALVTNFENAVGGDTCSSVLTGDWENPNIIDFFVSNVNTDSSISIDAYNQKLFLAIGDAYASSASTLFVYNLSDPANPILTDSIDNATGIKAGINDIHVADKYLYAAKTTGPASGQLQIFDISGSSPVKVGDDFKISGVTGTGDQAIGKSIFYKDGYIYLGLSKTDTGPEFNIIDVHDPSHPSKVGVGFTVGNGINKIVVKGKYAYLATDDASRELIILDISNPANPVSVSGTIPDLPGSLGYGKSLYLVGDRLYLGRTYTSDQEFYIFDASDINLSVPVLGQQEIAGSVNDLIIRDYLAFLITTNSQFQIWRIDNPSSITSYAADLSLPAAGEGKSLDCEGNYIYAGSVDTTNNKSYLSVITAPSP